MSSLFMSLLLSQRLLSAGSAAASIGATIPAFSVGTPVYSTAFSEDYESGNLTSVQASGATYNRANSTTNPISGTRSYSFDVTALADSSSFAEPYIPLTFVPYQRYRLSGKFRRATPLTITVGVRQDANPYLWVCSRTVNVTSTSTPVSMEFIYPITDTAASIRISGGLQLFTGLQIDEWKLETVAWDGLAISPDPMSNTLLGFHVNQNPANNGASLPWTIQRLWDSGTNWYNMAPTQGGPYNYARFDAHAAGVSAKGASLLYTLGVVPNYASLRPGASEDPYSPGSAGPITDLSIPVDFVTALFNHAGPGKIKFFELWNEADGGFFWKGTPAQMYALAQALYPVIKSLDPACVVIAPNTTASGMKLFEALLALGIDAYCDAYSYHNYMVLGERQALATSWNYRRMLTERGITKPLYMTEGALPDTTPGAITRQVIVQAAQGVKTICYYTLEGIYGTPGAALGVSPTFNTNTAIGDEFANVVAWLAGASPLASTFDSTSGVSRLLVRKASSSAVRLLVWSATTQTVTLPNTASLALSTSRGITGSSSAVSRDGAGNIVIALSAFLPLMLE